MIKSIIVTTPKSEMGNASKEAQECLDVGGGYYFRKIGKHKPKDVTIGKSRIYYVEDGYVRGFGIIGAIEKSQMICETTGREWGDNNDYFIITSACSWQWIKPIQMKGFQGWRYFKDEDKVETIGSWKDPKPLTEE